MEMDAGSLPDYDRERLLANDKDAYAAQQLSNLDWGAPDEDIVKMTLPTFVYAGTKDSRNHEPAKRCASLAARPNASFLSLPDHTHMQGVPGGGHDDPPRARVHRAGESQFMSRCALLRGSDILSTCPIHG